MLVPSGPNGNHDPAPGPASNHGGRPVSNGSAARDDGHDPSNGSAAASPSHGAQADRRGAARVDFEGVSFTYPGAGRPAICDLSLTIPAGAMVGVTGAVGSGKSGLAKALVGVYQLQHGQILLDGTPLTAMEAVERSALIGYLPQDPWLFSGTIRDNVVFGATELDGPTADALVSRAISWLRWSQISKASRPAWRHPSARAGSGYPAGSVSGSHLRGRCWPVHRVSRACWFWTIRSRPWTWTPRSGWSRG